ncbi:hypothetical protein ABIC83_002787 [Roseateles asaccharophilus]|uniref:hypothetical protein n=1 Tax=Roseateles asaccharophilus TaxID=582607 RepID=UPI003834F60F
MMFKNIRNSYDARSTNHHGNLFLTLLVLGVAAATGVFAWLETGDARQVLGVLAALLGACGLFLGLMWLNAKDTYFSENPEELHRDPEVQARELIERARRMSRGS